jgi:hypothetical protein
MVPTEYGPEYAGNDLTGRSMVSRKDLGGRALGFFGFRTLPPPDRKPRLGAAVLFLFPEIHGGRDIRTDRYGALTGTLEEFTRFEREHVWESAWNQSATRSSGKR